jgi:F-box and WD-40 domain protein CDC4
MFLQVTRLEVRHLAAMRDCADCSVYSLVYDRYRNRCASGSMDNTVKVWDVGTGQCLHTLSGHTALVGLLGISPNYLVSAAADATLRVWDANTNTLEHILGAHGGAITCFAHDETKLVSASEGSIKLWDIQTGRCVRELLVGIQSVWCLVIKGHVVVAARSSRGSTIFDTFDFGVSDSTGTADRGASDRPQS